MSARFANIHVVVPHFRGAKRAGRLDHPHQNVQITRFRYFWPYSEENVAYDRKRKGVLYPLKILLYIGSQFLVALNACRISPKPIINAHWLVPQGFVAVLVRTFTGCKVVISVHGADVFTLNAPLFRAIKRLVLRNGDVVVVNSSATKDACNRLFERDYPIIPMGIDISHFRPPTTRPMGYVFQLLFVGRLVEEKGINYVCQAIKILTEKGFRVHLNVVGDGPLNSQIVDFIQKYGLQSQVSLVGWVQQEQLADYYHRANAFVGPSIQVSSGWKEAFGLALAEAMATGLPVVTTQSGGIQDLVKHEVNGLLVPERDAEAVAKAIIRLQQDPDLCAILGQRGSSLVREKFSWEIIANRYEAVFRKL